MNLTAEHQTAPSFDTYANVAVGGIGIGSGVTPANFGQLRLGARFMTRDGRVFRWCRMGAVAGVPGSLYQSSVIVPNHLAQTPAAAAVGATAVTITTLGATAATQNQYGEGWLQVDTTPGQGQMYGIDSHLANAGSAALILNLYKDDAIQVALTTSSRVGLIANPYADVLVVPTTATGVVVGVPHALITAASYGWLQTWGPCALLINGTPANGVSVINSATTAGAADVAAVANEAATRFVGRMMQIGVSGKNNAVMLMIAP